MSTPAVTRLHNAAVTIIEAVVIGVVVFAPVLLGNVIERCWL